MTELGHPLLIKQLAVIIEWKKGNLIALSFNDTQPCNNPSKLRCCLCVINRFIAVRRPVNSHTADYVRVWKKRFLLETQFFCWARKPQGYSFQHRSILHTKANQQKTRFFANWEFSTVCCQYPFKFVQKLASNVSSAQQLQRKTSIAQPFFILVMKQNKPCQRSCPCADLWILSTGNCRQANEDMLLLLPLALPPLPLPDILGCGDSYIQCAIHASCGWETMVKFDNTVPECKRIRWFEVKKRPSFALQFASPTEALDEKRHRASGKPLGRSVAQTMKSHPWQVCTLQHPPGITLSDIWITKCFRFRCFPSENNKQTTPSCRVIHLDTTTFLESTFQLNEKELWYQWSKIGLGSNMQNAHRGNRNTRSHG